MRWRKTSKPMAAHQGFTIIEVMIVLGVTGLMFLSVVLVINGKQQSAQFQTSVHNMESQIRGVANEVSSGSFQNNSGTLDCKDNLATLQITSKANDNTPAAGQCNYIGKVLHFYSGATSDQFSVYSVLGVDDGRTVSSNAKPVVVASSGLDAVLNPNGIDTTEDIKLSYGLTISSIKFTDSSYSGADVGSFGFIQSADHNINDKTAVGSSQHLNVMVFPYNNNSKLANTKFVEAGQINQSFAHGVTPADGTLVMCLASGSTSQYATISIGTDTSQLDISSKVSSTPC